MIITFSCLNKKYENKIIYNYPSNLIFLGNNINFKNYHIIFQPLNEYVKSTHAKIYDHTHKINSKDNLTINGIVNSTIITKI